MFSYAFSKKKTVIPTLQRPDSFVNIHNYCFADGGEIVTQITRTRKSDPI